LDILKIGSESGLALSEYKYLGFGGFKFYDFEMVFRHLGIRKMTSVELDETLIPRCKYNKPFEFIEMEIGKFSDYLDRAFFKTPMIAWLDYDSPLSKNVVDDILSLGGRVPVGSFVFVTIDGRMPRGLKLLPSEQQVADLREELQSFALDPQATDMEIDNFPNYAERVVWAALNSAFSARSDGVVVPLIRVFYDDTTLMITVGACLCPEAVAVKFAQRMKQEFNFLLPRAGRSPYHIPPFNFTIRERYLLDAAATANVESDEIRKALKRLGISRAQVAEYKRMVRFVPKYVESYI
jgi:hypothetical protein